MATCDVVDADWILETSELDGKPLPPVVYPERCRETAVARVTVCCPHNHKATLDTCAAHSVDRPGATCGTCLLAGHECPAGITSSEPLR